MMTKTDFENIIPTSDEIRILKQLKKGKSMELSDAEKDALYLTNLVSPDTSGRDSFGAPIPTGKFHISDNGMRFLIYRSRQKIETWIKPITISVVVSIITTIITNELLPLIKTLISNCLG